MGWGASGWHSEHHDQLHQIETTEDQLASMLVHILLNLIGGKELCDT